MRCTKEKYLNAAQLPFSSSKQTILTVRSLPKRLCWMIKGKTSYLDNPVWESYVPKIFAIKNLIVILYCTLVFSLSKPKSYIALVVRQAVGSILRCNSNKRRKKAVQCDKNLKCIKYKALPAFSLNSLSCLRDYVKFNKQQFLLYLIQYIWKAKMYTETDNNFTAFIKCKML